MAAGASSFSLTLQREVTRVEKNTARRISRLFFFCSRLIPGGNFCATRNGLCSIKTEYKTHSYVCGYVFVCECVCIVYYVCMCVEARSTWAVFYYYCLKEPGVHWLGYSGCRRNARDPWVLHSNTRALDTHGHSQTLHGTGNLRVNAGASCFFARHFSLRALAPALCTHDS